MQNSLKSGKQRMTGNDIVCCQVVLFTRVLEGKYHSSNRRLEKNMHNFTDWELIDIQLVYKLAGDNIRAVWAVLVAISLSVLPVVISELSHIFETCSVRLTYLVPQNVVST